MGLAAVWGVQFLFNKFDSLKLMVYVPNYNGGVDIYQLPQ